MKLGDPHRGHRTDSSHFGKLIPSGRTLGWQAQFWCTSSLSAPGLQPWHGLCLHLPIYGSLSLANLCNFLRNQRILKALPFHLVDMAAAQVASGLHTFKQSGLPLCFRDSFRGPDFPHERMRSILPQTSN